MVVHTTRRVSKITTFWFVDTDRQTDALKTIPATRLVISRQHIHTTSLSKIAQYTFPVLDVQPW